MSEPPPLCRCSPPQRCHLRTVRKEGANKGRLFWGCANYPDSCNYFKWAPPGTQNPSDSGGQKQQAEQQQRQPWQSPASQPALPWGQPQGRACQSPQAQLPALHGQLTPAASPSQLARRAPRFASPGSLAAAGRSYVPGAQSPGLGPSSQPDHAQQLPQQQGWSQSLPPQGGMQPPPSPQQRHAQQDGLQPGSSQPHVPPVCSPPKGSQDPSVQQQQRQLQHGGWASPPRGSPPGPQQPSGSQPQQHGSQPPSRQPVALPDGTLLGGAAGPGPPVKVNLERVDADTFGARFRFNEPLKDFLKSLPPPAKGVWDPQRKVWKFPLACYDGVVQQLREAAPVPVTISPIPSQALAGFEESRQVPLLPDAEVAERLRRLPPAIWDRLYGFQREGVRRAVQLGGRCLLADEMGLGKTVQALCIAAAFGPEDWPLLIVCPSTMKLVWADAVRTWLPPELAPARRNLAVVRDGQGIDRLLAGMDPSTSARVLIVSYDMVKKLGPRAADYPTVIADESHHLKNLETQRTQAVGALVKAATRAVLLSGTPALSRPVELYPQINMLRPAFLGTLHEFGMRYCDGRPAQFAMRATAGGYDFSGASNLPELHQLLEAGLMIRRYKKDVLADLPDKIRKRIPIEVDPAHSAGLRQVVRAMRQVEEDEAAGSISGEEAAQRRQQLTTEYFRRTGPAKVRDAKAHLGSLLEAGEKVLVFGHHQAVLDALQEELRGRRVPHVRIDGQVVNERRKEAVDRFQSDNGCRAALLSITAAGVGITLTAATVCVFVELYWNPSQLVQAEDRAHRLGQKRALEVHYLIAPGSADDSIWELCKHKLGVVGGALGEESAEEAFERVRTSAKYSSVVQLLAQRAAQQQREREKQQQPQQQPRHQAAAASGSSGDAEVVEESGSQEEVVDLIDSDKEQQQHPAQAGSSSATTEPLSGGEAGTPIGGEQGEQGEADSASAGRSKRRRLEPAGLEGEGQRERRR